MIRKHETEVPATSIAPEGFRGMTARFALTKDDGCPRYAMRIMEFEPGGHTSLHAHAEEHEFYTTFWKANPLAWTAKGERRGSGGVGRSNCERVRMTARPGTRREERERSCHQPCAPARTCTPTNHVALPPNLVIATRDASPAQLKKAPQKAWNQGSDMLSLPTSSVFIAWSRSSGVLPEGSVSHRDRQEFPERDRLEFSEPQHAPLGYDLFQAPTAGRVTAPVLPAPAKGQLMSQVSDQAPSASPSGKKSNGVSNLVVAALVIGGLAYLKPWQSFGWFITTPTIQITGQAAPAVRFSDWKANGRCSLEGKMTFAGGLPVGPTAFTAYVDGVVHSQGLVEHPALEQGQAGRTSLFIPSCELPKIDKIVIEVNLP